MSTIAVTGADQALRTDLVAALGARDDLGRTIVLAPPAIDLADQPPAAPLADVDVLIYLGGGYDRTRGLDRHAERAMVHRALDAARGAGVGQVIVASSVLAYGAHPDNAFPLTETSPLRGIDAFDLAEHARDVELWLADWQTGQDPRVAVLRFAPLLGPDVDSWLSRALEAPRIPAVKGHRPPLQFLHPDDAVAAFIHTVEHRLAGSYNVAADGWLSFDEVTAIVGRRVVDVPEEVAYRSVEGLWSLGLGDQRPGVIDVFSFPCVMSVDRFTATGWRARHSNRDAVAAMVTEHDAYLTFGPIRTRRATVRIVGVVASLLAAAAGWTAVALARRWWRRRHTTDPV